MNWLIQWGIPFACIAAAVLVVWMADSIRRLPYRRFEKPVEGVNGLYLPATWKPRGER